VKKTLEHLGNAAAILGVVLCCVAGFTRFAGFFYLAGFELMSLFFGGMGFMLGACLAKLHVLGMASS
jgi:hypothetical protein